MQCYAQNAYLCSVAYLNKFRSQISFISVTMAPTDRKGKKKSAINETVTREYTINMHKRIHGMWVHLGEAGQGSLLCLVVSIPKEEWVSFSFFWYGYNNLRPKVAGPVGFDGDLVYLGYFKNQC